VLRADQSVKLIGRAIIAGIIVTISKYKIAGAMNKYGAIFMGLSLFFLKISLPSKKEAVPKAY